MPTVRRLLRFVLPVLGLGLVLGAPASTLAAPMVEAKGLMPGMAVLLIDGRQHILKVGDTSPEGVQLVSADANKARLRMGQKEVVITLSSVVGGRFAERDAAASVQVFRDTNGRYRVPGSINGRGVNFLVDTGATILAMSSRQATALGIDYYAGQTSMVSTASGTAKSWLVRLRQVSVGDIDVANVEAAVIEGAYPQEILLGHSFLQYVAISEDAGVMTLHQKF